MVSQQLFFFYKERLRNARAVRRHRTIRRPSKEQQTQQQQEGGGTIAEAEEAPDMFTDAVHSLEQTLVQVAEQIETFNIFLEEELSREYLGYDGGECLFLEYYYQDAEEQQILIPRQLATCN